jgi:FtsZ-interacting cell division protein ZipA
MQTSKFSVVICALIACAPLTMRATDTPAQAAARAVVEAKLKELDGAAATATPATAAVAAPASVAPVAATEPAMKPVNQTKAEKAAAKLKAKQDAEKAAADLKAQKQAAKMEAARMEADKAAAKKQAAEKAKAERAAAKAKLTTPAPTQAAKVDAGSDIGLKLAATPTLPIGSSKEARLQALLAKYQADQISPEDYHKQRAAILAEP